MMSPLLPPAIRATVTGRPVRFRDQVLAHAVLLGGDEVEGAEATAERPDLQVAINDIASLQVRTASQLAARDLAGATS